jgi:hypothetical protein
MKKKKENREKLNNNPDHRKLKRHAPSMNLRLGENLLFKDTAKKKKKLEKNKKRFLVIFLQLVNFKLHQSSQMLT